MPEPKKSPLPQAEMKPIPQNETVGAIAGALRRAQQFGSQYKIPESVPLLGGMGADEMLGLPGAAAEVERWSYGDYPLTMENTGAAGYIPRVKTVKGEDGRRESRMMDLLDTAGVAAPIGGFVKKVGTNLVQTAPYVARDMLESATNPMRSYVIKPKGGNWLTPTETRTEIPDIYAPNERRPQAKPALESMYEVYGPNLEAVQGNPLQHVFEENVKKLKTDTAIDDWINSNLTNYVKKEMATPEDPVRKLAEEGIHFMTPTQVDRLSPLAAYSHVNNIPKRIGAGFPEEGMGKSQEARAWEALSDAAIDVEYADEYGISSPAVDRQLEADPWISKLNPDDPLYSIGGNYRGFDRHIDFEKVIKSLREDVDEGAIRPEQLNKVSVADAVRRFYEKNIARQNVAFASRLERPAVKEYPEQGFRWVKLDQPGDFAAESDAMQHSVRGYEPYKGSEEFVADLGGDEGYGLGGWDAIKYGDAEVYSLVDSKGRPHATIEVETVPGGEDLEAWFKELSRPDRIKAQEAVRSFRRANPHLDELEDYHIKDALSIAGIKLGGPRITQIKGKQNRPPNPEYQPFVQDFIKSREWSDVDELGNANLIRIDPESDVAAIFRSEGLDVPKYISQDELTAVRRRNMGMAKGGKVKLSDNPVTMQLELAGGGLVKRMAKAIGKAAEEAGQKPPVLAEKELTTLQDVHTNLGDRVRAGVIDSQKMMEGFDYKYDKGQRVFTKDSAGKNKPPYTILNRTRVGNQVMREDHPEFGPGMGRPIVDPETGKAMRTPYEPGYRVRMERGPDDWSEFEIPEKAIVGDVEMAGGGAVKRFADKLAKALPKSKADENLERFLAESQIKNRLYHGTGADITEFRPSRIGAMGPGTYLSTSPKEASGYAGILNRDYEVRPNVLPVFAQAKNPFVISSVNKSAEELFKRFDPEGKLSDDEVIQLVKDAGYDSIYAKDSGELNMFNTSSIKSAIGNRGTYDTKKKDITKAKGGAVRMGAGGSVAKKIAEALAKSAAKDTAKEAPAVAKKPVQEAIKASEALGKYEGRPLVITQTDRTKTGGKWLGGPGFSSLQLSRPEYAAAEAAWGVAKPGAAKMILGGGKKAGDNPLYTTMIGTPTQHQSNNMVFAELHRLFNRSAKEGNLDPELYLKINDRLRSAVDKNGNPVFPPDVDILSPKFRNLADTFDRRLVASNLMGGVGVGGKKGQIIDYDKIIRHTTDPDLIDAPSGALGNRLFTLTGNVVERPDLHPAFPSILQGEDLGVKFKPVPRELVMKDFADRIMREKGRKPGYMDYTRGHPPSQMLTEELLTELQKQGYKKGGSVNKTSTSNKPRKKVAFTDNLDTMRLAVGLK